MSKKNQNKIGIFVLLGLVSCTPSPETTESNRPLVVATTSILCDLTEQIAQDTVNLQCLADAGVDPHVYQPTPEDRKAIDTAQLILYGGYDFDNNLVKLVKATENSAPKVAVFEQAVTEPIIGDAHEHHHHEGEATAAETEHHHHEGESTATETAPDPHVWHDPSNGISMVTVIAQELGNLQPQQAQEYQKKADAINSELGQIDQWIKNQIATIPPEKRKLVTTHDALGYYVNAYNLEFEGALEGFSTEESPTATRVKELTQEIRKTQVPTIFAESSNNPKLIETVAREAQVKVSEQELYTDTLGKEGTDGDSYQKMLISNTQAIVEGLGGNYQSSSAK